MPDNKNVIIEDAELLFRNFTGKQGMYNQEGDRSFAVKLPTDVADDMVKNGWNVKTLRLREDEEVPQPYISVAVEYRKGKPPTIIMMSSRGRTVLDVDTVEMLDQVDIEKADVMLNAHDWTMPTGASGRKAYLKALYITINENPLELKYGSIADVSGPMMQMTGPYIPSDEQ